jgi:hypothetical protein
VNESEDLVADILKAEGGRNGKETTYNRANGRVSRRMNRGTRKEGII